MVVHLLLDAPDMSKNGQKLGMFLQNCPFAFGQDSSQLSQISQPSSCEQYEKKDGELAVLCSY